MIGFNPNGSVFLENPGSNTEQFAVSLPIDTNWHFLAVTMNVAENNTCVYIDTGAPVCNPYSFVPGSGNVNADDIIGASTWGGLGYFNGTTGNGWAGISITQISKWSVDLPQIEISNIRTSGITGSPSGLLAYYDFHEGSGSTISDVSGHAAAGTLSDYSNGTLPIWVPGVTGDVPSVGNLGNTDTSTSSNSLGTSTSNITGSSTVTGSSTTSTTNYALQFSKANSSYVSTPSIDTTSDSDITLEFRIKTTDTNGAVIGSENWGQPGSFVLMIGSGQLYFQAIDINNNIDWANGSAPSADSSLVTDGAWHHVALVQTGGFTNMYIDGVQKFSYNMNLLQYSSVLTIGASTIWGSFSDHTIDDVRISNMARYVSDFSGSVPTSLSADNHTLALWKFDDGSGSVAVDSSTNVNNAVLIGNPSWISVP